MTKPPFKTVLEESDAIARKIDEWRDRIDWLTARNGTMKPAEISEVLKLSGVVADAYTASLALRLAAARKNNSQLIHRL